MSKHAFEKFIKKSPTGAKKKEEIRQEKKKFKAEVRSKFEAERKRNEEKFRLVSDKDKRAGNSEESKKYQIRNIQDNTRVVKPAQPLHKKSTQTYSQNILSKQTNEKLTRKSETGNPKSETDLMPLNKFIAHAGVCGRREAAGLVKEGKVKVNGSINYEPGFKLSLKDKVEVNGKQVFIQKNLVYLLTNKPKDCITTAKDPAGRKTIFDIIKGATKERIYPVGRLDRNTTGVLLMTNDGELSQKLTHPSFEVKKLYEVKLDKPLTKKDFETVLNGVTLEDGFVKADAVAYADAKDKTVIGIEIHSGRNRVVRRIFESLGYDVKNLDRVMFANLTKKNVDRGKWRFLNEREVRLLKYMNQSFVRANKE